MKKRVALLVLLLSVVYCTAQFSKTTIEPSFGFTKIRDITPVERFNVDLAVRHMLNTKFGVRLDGRFTRLYEEGVNEPITYKAATIQGVVNVGRVLNFETITKNYTILGAVGGTYIDSDYPTNNTILHRRSNFHLSARIDNEVRLNNTLSLMASLDVVTGVNNRPFVPSSTETTSIINFNVGVAINLNPKKEHADWYIPKKKTPVCSYKKEYELIDKSNNTINPKYFTQDTHTENKQKDFKQNEYVFFDHNSHKVDKDGLNAITKTMDKMEDEDSTLTIVGHASPPGTSGYNLILADKRILSVVQKFESLGLDKSRITFKTIGETDTKDHKNVDLERRVELIINKK